MTKELGATHALNGKEVDVVAEVKQITGGSHYAVETPGVPPVVNQSLNALRPLFGTVHAVKLNTNFDTWTVIFYAPAIGITQ